MKFKRYLLTESLSQTWVENQFMYWTREIWGERAFEQIKKVLSFTNIHSELQRLKKKKTSALMAVIHPPPGGKAIGNYSLELNHVNG